MKRPHTEPEPEVTSRGAHEIVVPVVAEEIVVGKRGIERERVRVTTHTDVRDVDVDVVCGRDEVVVERVPIGRAIESLPEIRVERGTTIIPIVEEVAFVEKRLVLREELRVTKRRVEHVEHVQVRLERQRAEVSRASPSDASQDDETNMKRGG